MNRRWVLARRDNRGSSVPTLNLWLFPLPKREGKACRLSRTWPSGSPLPEKEGLGVGSNYALRCPPRPQSSPNPIFLHQQTFWHVPFARNPTDHRERQCTLAFQDLGSAAVADQRGKIGAGVTVMGHCCLDCFDRVHGFKRPALFFIRLNQGCEHIQTVTFRRAFGSAPQCLDLAQ